MDQYRSRLKLSENFENDWSIPFPGEIRMDQWSWKFFKSFPYTGIGPWMAGQNRFSRNRNGSRNRSNHSMREPQPNRTGAILVTLLICMLCHNSLLADIVPSSASQCSCVFVSELVSTCMENLVLASTTSHGSAQLTSERSAGTSSDLTYNPLRSHSRVQKFQRVTIRGTQPSARLSEETGFSEGGFCGALQSLRGFRLLSQGFSCSGPLLVTLGNC